MMTHREPRGNFSKQPAVDARMIGAWFRMFEPRQEFMTPEFRRYAAECRRLATIARPVAKPAPQKRAAPLLRGADWFGSLAAPFRTAPKPARKLVTT